MKRRLKTVRRSYVCVLRALAALLLMICGCAHDGMVESTGSHVQAVGHGTYDTENRYAAVAALTDTIQFSPPLCSSFSRRVGSPSRCALLRERRRFP
jgi:hypothetical protein